MNQAYISNLVLSQDYENGEVTDQGCISGMNLSQYYKSGVSSKSKRQYW